MEQKIVPTSPRSEYKQYAGTSTTARRSRSVFVVAVTSIVLGAAAGFFGFMIAATIPSDWPVLGALNVTELFRREQDQVLFTGLRSGSTSVAEQAPEVLQQVVTLYPSIPSRDKNVASSGNALILTADGWMVTPTAVFEQHNPDIATPVVVLSNGETATVVRTITDEAYGLTFFHVDEQSLPFVQFTADLSLRVGQSVAVIEKDLTGITVAEDRVIGEVNRPTGPRRTSTVSMTTQVNNTHRTSNPVFSSSGQVVGMMVGEKTVAPASVIQSAMQSITTGNTIQHVVRDITYINLAQVTDKEKETNGLPDTGIEVIAIDRVQDLEQGDIIMNINNVGVDEATDLAAVLHSKPAGTLWRMVVVRNGVETTIDVKS